MTSSSIRPLSLTAWATVVVLAGCHSMPPGDHHAHAVPPPAGAAAAPAAAVTPPATPGFTSKPVLTSALPSDPNKDVVVISVQIDPGSASPRHTHPGECAGFVYEGTVELVAEGQEARRFNAGQGFLNAGGVVHQFRNVGDKPVRMSTTLIVEKGKPRTSFLPPAGK